jgi:glutathione reductase (NADPH)
LGSETHVSYRGDLFLRHFDHDIREHMRDSMTAKGINLHFNSEVQSIEKTGNKNELKVTLKEGGSLLVDCVFCAIGRRPMLDNLGLENVNIDLDEQGLIKVNTEYETSEPGILAIGDLIAGPQLTPVALAEGMAVARRLFRQEEYKPVSYENIATAVFTLPNIATVGMSEEQAKAAGYDVSVFSSSFRPMKLSFSDSTERIFMKLVVDRATDKVLGCHMVGPDAGELIQGLAVALKAGATKAVFDDTIGIHPTAAEEFVTMRTPVR